MENTISTSAYKYFLTWHDICREQTSRGATRPDIRVISKSYFPVFEVKRMVVYKAMCDLLWTLWGLIQFANKNPVDDFWAYSTGRFERCKTLMGSEDFGRHLAAIAD